MSYTVEGLMKLVDAAMSATIEWRRTPVAFAERDNTRTLTAMESAKNDVRAYASALAQPPAGWVMVPAAPTPEWAAAMEPMECYQGVAADQIRVMLKKAPKFAPVPEEPKPAEPIATFEHDVTIVHPWRPSK